MIPYYSPNFKLRHFFASLFVTQAEAKIIDFFKTYTGKKYILLTASCRQALYLSYRALGTKGNVITSPLTCRVAIEPIIAAGNAVKYADVKQQSLVLDVEKLVSNQEAIALQLIHLGGQSVNTKQARALCDDNGWYMIEDCAQGFYSKSNGLYNGECADVACYSLIKNAYSIGGGVLATDNKEIYHRAKESVGVDATHSRVLILYRIVRNIIESYRGSFVGEKVYQLLISLRSEKGSEGKTTYQNSLTKIEKKIAAYQLLRSNKLNENRRVKAAYIISALTKVNVTAMNASVSDESSFTKLYIYHPAFNAKTDIEYLNTQGIEAKHLEQKIGDYYQDVFCDIALENFKRMHDNIISIPLLEEMSQKQMNKLIEGVTKLIDHK